MWVLLPMYRGPEAREDRGTGGDTAPVPREVEPEMSPSRSANVSGSMNPKDLPQPLLWGLAVGVVAFVINATTYSSRSVNGVVTECSSFDFAALLAAVGCVGCAVVGLVQGLRGRREGSASTWLVLGVAAALVLLAGVHALRAVGTIGGPC